MPGMRSRMHAVLNRTGAFSGMSANYSGAGFSDMRFKLYGVTAAGFDDWVSRVKTSGPALDTNRFLLLEKPSEKVPALYFSGVQDDLFDRIFRRCVKPGTVCASGMHGGSHAPAKPEGAIFKDGPTERTGESVTPQPGEQSGAAHPHQER